MSVTFELYKLSKYRYELRYNGGYVHGKNNTFNTELEAIEYYKAFVSSWDCSHLDIKFKESTLTITELYAKIGL